MSYASRLRSRLDQRTPTANVGYVGRNLQGPGEPVAFGAVKFRPSEEYFEERFEALVTGGFNRNRICNGCMIALPASGQCDYC